MLRRLCEDLAANPAYRVVTTLDVRIKERLSSTVTQIAVDTYTAEQRHFTEQSQQADLTIVIAPEFDGLLANRIRQLNESNARHNHSDLATIELAADKLKLSQWLFHKGFPTPVSYGVAATESYFSVSERVGTDMFLKPRFGAGSVASARIRSFADWECFWQREDVQVFQPMIAQPYYPGVPISLTALIHPLTGRRELCPLARQLFADGNYVGGEMPWHSPKQHDIQELILRLLDELPGLRGYIGFDLMIDPCSPDGVTIMEINPRLTTSYLGYRQLTNKPLIPWFLGEKDCPEVSWKSEGVRFDIYGAVIPVSPASITADRSTREQSDR